MPLPKPIVNIICALIPNEKKRKSLRDKLLWDKLLWDTKKLSTRGNSFISLSTLQKPVTLDGENNKIQINTKAELLRLHLNIFGNNNTIQIGSGLKAHTNIRISIGTAQFPCNNCRVVIGENADMNDVNLQLMEDSSFIEIGDDCLFSWGIELWATDSHAIFNCANVEQKEKRPINYGKFIKIGAHVWVGMDVKINKNVEIADGCIIGWGSVVTRSFLTPNSVIAGNPARLVNTGRYWDYRPANFFNEKNI